MGKRLTCFTACFSQSKKKKYQITDKSKKKWEAEIEKYLVEPSIVEKQPSIGVKLPDPLIDERRPPLVVEDHPDPLIDEDCPSLISEKRPPLIVEKHPDPLIDEKCTPLSNENHPDPLIDEKHPDPLVDEKHRDPLIDETPPPLIDEKYPDPLVDEKHRDPLIDETPPPLIDEKYPDPLVDEKHPGPPIIEKHPPVIDEKHPDPLIDEQHHTLFDTKHQDPLIHLEHPGPSSSFIEAVQSPHFPIEEVKPTEPETEHTKHVCSEEKTTSVEPTVVAEVVQELYVTEVTPTSEKSKEEVAAIKIQTVFRGRLARNELQALSGLHRLKTLMDGDSVKHQAKTTLQCMQTLARVQSQIRARRTRMSEENQSLQRQLHQKREQDLEKLRMGDEWDDSKQSKEQIEANLLHKYEAAIKRERAKAYAYAHQPTSKIPKSVNPTFMDPKNPHWGWSWLERWMAARPWERNAEKEFIDNLSSGKYEFNGEKLTPKVKIIRRPASRRSPSASPSVARSASSLTGKVRPSTPSGDSCTLDDDDTRSTKSMRPVRVRRNSVGSSFRDDGSVTSSPSSVPSYMGSTKSAKAKQSPLGVEKNETPEKGSVVSAKKRLSFSGPLADPRQNSLPPKMTH